MSEVMDPWRCLDAKGWRQCYFSDWVRIGLVALALTVTAYILTQVFLPAADETESRKPKAERVA